MLKIEIFVTDKDSYDVACEVFSTHSTEVTVVKGSIVNASHACIATAGNSFGAMSGGVDGVVNTHLSAYTPDSYVSDRVKRAIKDGFYGELPVGTAIAVATDHPKHKLLIYAPTMRVPAPLPGDTIAPYLAMRAVLCTALREKVDGVSMPLFGTGAGEVPVRKACGQMHRALTSIDQLRTMINVPNDLPELHKHDRVIRTAGHDLPKL